MKVTLKYFLLVSKMNGQQHSLLENYAFLHRLRESRQTWCANEYGNPGTLLITSIHMNSKKEERKSLNKTVLVPLSFVKLGEFSL